MNAQHWFIIALVALYFFGLAALFYVDEQEE